MVHAQAIKSNDNKVTQRRTNDDITLGTKTIHLPRFKRKAWNYKAL